MTGRRRRCWSVFRMRMMDKVLRSWFDMGYGHFIGVMTGFDEIRLQSRFVYDTLISATECIISCVKCKLQTFES